MSEVDRAAADAQALVTAHGPDAHTGICTECGERWPCAQYDAADWMVKFCRKLRRLI